jgi:uncharacterized protein with PIN domain
MSRSRTARRELERELDKARALARKLYALDPGGSPEQPIEVVSPSQVEIDAEAQRCAVCQGALRVDAHEVTEHRGLRLRVARSTCRGCGARWDRYYRIGAVLN